MLIAPDIPSPTVFSSRIVASYHIQGSSDIDKRHKSTKLHVQLTKSKCNMPKAMVRTSSCCYGMLVLLIVMSETSAAFSVKGQRVTGVYNGLAVMRCSLVPSYIHIGFIEWREGKTDIGQWLYFDNLRNKEKRRGKFIEKNVTGQIGHNGSSYDLIIYNVVPEDDMYYYCRIKPKTEGEMKGASIKLTLVAPPDSPSVITNTQGVNQTTSNCSHPESIPSVIVDGHMSFVCSIGGSKPYPVVQWYYGGNSKIYHMSASPEYRSRTVLVKNAKQQIDVTVSENNTLRCTVIAPDADSGRMEETHLCLNVVRRTPWPGAILVYLIPVPIFLVLLLVAGLFKHRYGYLLKNGEETTQYLLPINISFIIASGHICMGVFVSVHTFGICLMGTSFIDGPIQVRTTGSIVLIVVWVYLFLRFLLNVFAVIVATYRKLHLTCATYQLAKGKVVYIPIVFVCGISTLVLIKGETTKKQKRDPETEIPLLDKGTSGKIRYVPLMAFIVIDITMSGSYLVAIIWNYMTGDCLWNDGSVVLLMFLAYLGYVVHLTAGLGLIYRLQKEIFQPWPLTKAAHKKGPIAVNINNEPPSEEELRDIVILASAIASSRVKGYINIVNTQHKTITGEMFVRWKNRVLLLLKQLVGENPGELFEFCRNTANEEHFYLHILPASTPLLVPHKFEKQEVMPDTKKELIKKMVKMVKMCGSYNCFVLNEDGKPVKLPHTQFKEKMDQILKLMDAKKIPGFPDEEMKKFKRVEIPNLDCVVFTMHGVDDKMTVKTGLNVWPREYEELLKSKDNTRDLQKLIITKLKEHHQHTNGLLYVSSCIENDIRKQHPKKNEAVLCDILVLSSTAMPLLLTFGFDKEELSKYTENILPYLDQSLSYSSDRSFYIRHLEITTDVLEDEGWVKKLLEKENIDKIYPESYMTMGEVKLESIRCSLYTSLASFVPSTYVLDKEGMDCLQIMNLLTLEQLEALKQLQIKPSTAILIHGFPGSGKTILITEYIKLLRSMGSDEKEILYVAYSNLLAEQIKKIKLRVPGCQPHEEKPLCQVTSASDMLMWTELPVELRRVRWWILDDLQNFSSIEKRQKPLKEVEQDANLQAVSLTSRASRHDDGNEDPQPYAEVGRVKPVQSWPATNYETKEEPIPQRTKSKHPIFKDDAPEDHWLTHLMSMLHESTIEQILMVYDPTQAFGDKPQEEITLLKKNIEFDKTLELKQVSRNSLEITKFIYTELIPEVEKCHYEDKLMAHNFKGDEPVSICYDGDKLAELRKIINKCQHQLHDKVKAGELGIIIHKSAVRAEALASVDTDAVGDEASANVDTTWRGLSDYVGTEIPVIIAVVGPDTYWRQKVAIASRARVQLYWVELSQQVSEDELVKLIGKNNSKYIAWVTGKPAIAVFAGRRRDTYTGKCLERVIAAPVTPHGLGGGYTQVEAIPGVRHPREEAAVVRYKGEVWLIGGKGEDGKTLGVCDVLDLATWQWRQGAPLSLMSPRYWHTVTEVGGMMVAVGGLDDGSEDLKSVETLVSGSDWQPAPDLPEGRRSHAACEWNGRVWVSGGGLGDRSVMSFCPGEDRWRQEASLTEGRYVHTMAGIGPNRMLVCGGFTDSVEEYNSESRTWSTLTERLPEKMCYSSLIVYGQARYIVGGRYSTSTLRYDGHWHKEQHRLPLEMYDTVACLIELP